MTCMFGLKIGVPQIWYTMKVGMTGNIVNVTKWYKFAAGSRSSANGTAKFDIRSYIIQYSSTVY